MQQADDYAAEVCIVKNVKLRSHLLQHDPLVEFVVLERNIIQHARVQKRFANQIKAERILENQKMWAQIVGMVFFRFAFQGLF